MIETTSVLRLDAEDKFKILERIRLAPEQSVDFDAPVMVRRQHDTPRWSIRQHDRIVGTAERLMLANAVFESATQANPFATPTIYGWLTDSAMGIGPDGPGLPANIEMLGRGPLLPGFYCRIGTSLGLRCVTGAQAVLLTERGVSAVSVTTRG